MTLCSMRGTSDPRWRFGLVFALVALLLAIEPALCASDTIKVVVDQAKLIKLPDRVATLVIGNPLIADAALQPGGTMILTGKGYGATNLVALDSKGKVLMERTVQVEAPHEAIFVYRGVDRQTYSCTPTCERRVMLGDADAAFSATLAQTTARNSQTQGAAH